MGVLIIEHWVHSRPAPCFRLARYDTIRYGDVYFTCNKTWG